MEEKILEKEYVIPYKTFDDAFLAYQKKFVCPRSYILSGLFLFIAIAYIYSAIQDPSNSLAYILIFVSLAFSFINWINPKRSRRRIMEGIKVYVDDRYRFELFDTHIEISTILPPEEKNEEESAESEHEKELFGDEPEEVTESSKLYFNDHLKVIEKDEFFVLYQVRENIYVVPKAEFSEDEISKIREKLKY